jgi:hypothetical protein
MRKIKMFILESIIQLLVSMKYTDRRSKIVEWCDRKLEKLEDEIYV